jgi:hypothetical protein
MNTSSIRITIIISTFIIVIASRRSISGYTSLLRVAMSIMASIRSVTLSRNIWVDTTKECATVIICTGIVIITYNLFIFTRVFSNTIRIATILSTSVVIITIYFIIDASNERNTYYRLTSISIFTNIRFILASLY